MTGRDTMIEVDRLVKSFGDFTAVDDISFQVEAGETFGFLGPNGAGKTTTINILCTLMKPTSGRVTVNGFDGTREPTEVRRSIGLVFQDPSLDNRLSARQNLVFHAHIYGVPRAERRERIDEVLRVVELWERRHEEVRLFSGGMRRRLEIARGLLHTPRVLFLDEPTMGLDPQTRAKTLEYIVELKERHHITLFLTTHYMDEANIADRIAIIDHGKIVALDTPDALKRQVGGDIITLKTEDDEAAAAEIHTRFGIEASREKEGLLFETEDGGAFIPGLVTRLETRILSVGMRRPTLDDVFLKLTGREIREETGADSDLGKPWKMRPIAARGGRIR